MSMLKLHTDGGCHGNPGPGGWAYTITDINDRVVASSSGYAPETTNNRMELTAVIRGLHAVRELPDCDSCIVITDSQYVRQGITDWIYRWQRNGWLTTARKPVKNADLWKDLTRISDDVQPEWTWVKGHAGDQFNEACDRMVQEAIARQGQA